MHCPPVLPSSWGTSVIRLPCSNPTPAGLLASDHCDTAAWPLVCKKQRLPRKVFRSSIAWLSDWLSTLRGVSYPSTTQDSLPVAGQALLDGISTRKVPLKGFKVADYISFPFPKLGLAQLHRPKRVRSISSAQSSQNLGPDFWETCSQAPNLHRCDLSGAMIGLWLCWRLRRPYRPQHQSFVQLRETSTHFGRCVLCRLANCVSDLGRDHRRRIPEYEFRTALDSIGDEGNGSQRFRLGSSCSFGLRHRS